MKKRGNISLEGYRKNSPDRFNDFNIIPSQHIDMNNVNHDVLMIPMGGRGTGNPILAKPGERYFFPNHDFVFEQGMPENATMRYQRIAKFGGNLPKAQMYNSQVGVIPTLDNQFIYPSNFKYEEGTPVQNRAQGCQGPNCLEGANTYYNRYVAPKFGLPDTWKMNEAYGIVSGDPNQPYGVSMDSWDAAAEMQAKGAIQNYAAPLYSNNVRNTEKEAQAYWNMMSPEEKKKLYSQLALGSLVNFGDYGGLHGERLKGSNQKAGLYPSRHSTRVVGYTEEGIPMIYDMGQIRRIDDPKYDFPLTNITTPKELAKYNYDYVKDWQNKNQKKLDYNPKEKLLLGKKSIRENEDPFTQEENQYVEGINKNIKNLMQATGASQDDIIKAGKVAFGILEAETRGGRGSAKAKIKELAKTVTPFTSEASKGLTRIKPEMQAGDETNKYSQYMKTLGLNPKDLDLWDPEQAALATTALILSRKGDIEGVDKWYLRAQQHNTPGVGPKNEQRLKDADKDYANNVIRNASRIYSSKTGYGLPETEKWMNTKKAEKEKQEGEKIWSERFRPNIMRTESTGYIPNIPSMTQRAYGGDLPKAQMYNSQVNKPMPNFDPRVMGPAMRQQQIAAHNRAVAQSSTPDVLQERVPQKFESKALDVLTNPFTAATNMYQHGYLPDNFTQGQSNYLDLAQDYINPASLGRSMYNAATNVFDPEMYKDFAKAGAAGMLDLTGKEIPQEYKDASMRSLQRLGDMASAVPGIKSASPYVKKALETTQKQLSKGAKVAANVADKKIIKPLQELTQRTTPIQNYTQLNNIKTSNNFNDLDAVSNYFYNKFGSTDNLLKNLKDKDFDTRIIDAVFNHGNDEEKIKLANHLYDVLQGSKIDRALNKADEFVGKKLVKGVKAPDLKEVVEKANEKLAKGVGIKKGELPVKLSANNPNNRVSVKVGDDVTGFIDLSPVGKPAPKFSDILKGIQELKGVKPGFAKDYVDATNFRNAQFPGLAKSGDFPFTVAAEDVGKQLMGQGYSGEINKAISEALKERGSRLYSGATGHTDLGRQRYENLLNKGYVEDISPRIPGSYNMVQPGNEIFMYKKRGGALLNKTLTCPSCGWSWKAVDGGTDIATCHKCGGTAKMKFGGGLDELDEEYRRGGALPNRRETNKNIKSSINQLMRRNETLFGPRGRNFYNPNPMKKYYKGGIAFPQAPTAGDTPGQQESEFYAPNWIPKGPVGFYEHGGIAYPQQPTSDYFFSGSPWMAHYDMGGGLPSGANNMYMPCMNCGGYMEDGGMYYAEPGKIINPTPVPAMDADVYEQNVLAPKDQAYTQDLINKAKKQEEWDKAHPWTRSAGTTPEGAQLFHKTGQSGTPQDYFYNTKSGSYNPYNPTPVIAKQRYGGFQSGGFMSPDNMMDYPTFSQGGDPYDYADGGINNPGFRALPQNVQQNIISNMADGGNVADYDQDQYRRILGNNFISGVQGNMQNNIMSEAGMQFAQNPYQMPEGEYGYNMNSFNAPNMMNAGNMFDIQDKYDQLKNKNKGIGANMYNAGMFALGTANPHTIYKAKEAGKGTLPGTPDMARYGAAYIPKAQAGFNARQMKAAGMPELTFPSPSSASRASANPDSWMSPEAQAKKQAFRNEADAYDQKSAMYNQMQQAGYPNMMRQQGQFAPGFQSMYDNFGNDDYNVGRMSRGMKNLMPYLMFNPQNTYLQETEPVKNWLGRNVGTRMKFRTVFDPRTGQQVQVPAEGKGSAKGKADMMNDPNISRYSKEDLKLMYGTSDEPKGTSTQKDYEDMNMFERMKSNRQTKRMMKEEGRREKKYGVQNAIPENSDEEDYIKQDLEEQARREKKWGASKGIPYGDGLPGGIPTRPYGPDDISPYGNFPAGTTFANNMAYAPASAQSGYPTTSRYNFNASLNNTRPAYTPRDVFGTLSPNLSTGPLDQNKLMMQSLNKQRYGGMYEVGGIQELTEDEIQQIMEAGGSVTYLD